MPVPLLHPYQRTRRSRESNAPGRQPRRTRPQPAGRPPVRRLGPLLARNRRLAIAFLLCVAAAVAVHQLTPAPADSTTALAAARDLPAGSSLAPSDVAEVKVPPGMMAAGFIQGSAEAEGRQLAAPLRKGQLLTDAQLLGPGLLTGTPPGSAAVPLRMADPSSIQLVSPGQLVNVVLTGTNGYDQQAPPEVLATAVPVLWTSGQGGKTGEWLGTAETDGLIVVAARPEQAARLAGASTQGKLFFVLVTQPPG